MEIQLDGLARICGGRVAGIAAVPIAVGHDKVFLLSCSPRAALRYLSHMFRREPDRQAGHNPAGGWMVLLLLALLLGETITGLYVANDVADVGPFTEVVSASIANAITARHLA
jgi:cytochrome b